MIVLVHYDFKIIMYLPFLIISDRKTKSDQPGHVWKSPFGRGATDTTQKLVARCWHAVLRVDPDVRNVFEVKRNDSSIAEGASLALPLRKVGQPVRRLAFQLRSVVTSVVPSASSKSPASKTVSGARKLEEAAQTTGQAVSRIKGGGMWDQFGPIGGTDWNQ